MAYEIPIDAKKLDALLDSLDKGIDKVGVFDQKFKDLNNTIRDTQTVSGRTVTAATAGAGQDSEAPSYRSSRSARGMGIVGPRDSVNPYRGGGSRQTLAREEEALRRAEAIGDNDLILDQRARVRRAQRRVGADDKLLDDTPQQQLSQDELYKRMIMRSRVLPGGQISPLVMDLVAAGGTLKTPSGAQGAANTLKAIGIGGGKDLAPVVAEAASTALPLILKAGGVMAAIGGIIGIAEAGSARSRAANEAFYTMGGDPGNVGAAMALGGPDAARKALDFSERLKDGTIGAGYFRSMGIQNRGRYTDYSGNYVKGLDALRGISDVQERIRVARETGLTDDMWTADLGEGTYRRLRGSRLAAGGDGERRTEAEYRAQKEIAGGHWDSIVRSVGTPTAGVVGDWLGSLNLDPGSIGRSIGRGARTADKLMFGGVGGMIKDALDAAFVTPEKSTQKKTVKSRGWDTETPRSMPDGPRSINGSIQGSVPAGWRGQMMDKTFTDSAMAHGWWGG